MTEVRSEFFDIADRTEQSSQEIVQYQRAEPPGALLHRNPETATDPFTREGVARPCKVLSKDTNHDGERESGEVAVTPLDNGIPQPKPSEENQRGGEGGASITLLGN